jgi:methionyl-tRNA synthetase
MSSSTHLVYYVWIEALLSYMEMYQRYQKRHNIQNFYYFYGKDNEYYHKGILSQMTLESLESKDSNTFMRNYILDRNSQKQSSSSYNFLNLKDLKGNREVLRFVLASFDTLARDVCVDKESIELRVHTFFNKFINLYNRVIGILKKQKVTIQKSTQKYWDFKYYKSLMRSNTLKQTIDYLYNIQKILSNDIDTLIRSKNMSESQINMICHKCLEIFLYLKPFTPKISSYVLGNMRRLKSLSYNKVTLDFTELL